MSKLNTYQSQIHSDLNEMYQKHLDNFLSEKIPLESFIATVSVLVEDASFRLRAYSSIAGLKMKEAEGILRKPYLDDIGKLRNKYEQGVKIEKMLEHFILTEEQIRSILNCEK